jgi:hypothetical protein
MFLKIRIDGNLKNYRRRRRECAGALSRFASTIEAKENIMRIVKCFRGSVMGKPRPAWRSKNSLRMDTSA